MRDNDVVADALGKNLRSLRTSIARRRRRDRRALRRHPRRLHQSLGSAGLGLRRDDRAVRRGHHRRAGQPPRRGARRDPGAARLRGGDALHPAGPGNPGLVPALQWVAIGLLIMSSSGSDRRASCPSGGASWRRARGRPLTPPPRGRPGRAHQRAADRRDGSGRAAGRRRGHPRVPGPRARVRRRPPSTTSRWPSSAAG